MASAWTSCHVLSATLHQVTGMHLLNRIQGSEHCAAHAYGGDGGNTIAGRRVALRGAQRLLRAAAGVLGRSSPVPSGPVAVSWAEFLDLGVFQAWGAGGLAPLVGACGSWAGGHRRRDADVVVAFAGEG